jgi:hypothetical protein
MKTYKLLIGCIIVVQNMFGQNVNYSQLINKADSLYNLKEYMSSAGIYSNAFKLFGSNGQTIDSYNAARSWAMAKYPDSAFFHLNRIATEEEYSNYTRISTDPDLNALHGSNRWELLLYIIKQNKEKGGIIKKQSLISDLDYMENEIQTNRKQMMEYGEKYGWESKDVEILRKTVDEKDSIRLLQMRTIVEDDVWYGDVSLGDKISSAIFFTIHYSDENIQEKYLPLLREIVDRSKADATYLALTEDGVAIQQGKKQIYGTQVSSDNETHVNYVLPLEDPDNVDKRRRAIGLAPLSDYLKNLDVKWDVEQYKKDLQEQESKREKKK